jgi:type I restriction enzyme S subunit
VQNAEEKWEVKTIDEVGDIVSGSTPSKEEDDYFTKNGIPWITPKDLSLNVGNKFIKRGELDVTEKGKISASLNILPKGAVLMSSRAPIGYLAIARNDVTTNQGFKSFIPKSYFTTEFVYYTIQNSLPLIEKNASGSTFKEISTSTLKTISTLIPTKNIVKQFTNLVKPIFSRQELLEEQNQNLSALRDFLLPLLMNGQVVVGEKSVKEKTQDKSTIIPFKMPADDDTKYQAWKEQIGLAARGNIDEKTLRNIYEAIDEDDR